MVMGEMKAGDSVTVSEGVISPPASDPHPEGIMRNVDPRPPPEHTHIIQELTQQEVSAVYHLLD